jgi:hypothetical protein
MRLRNFGLLIVVTSICTGSVALADVAGTLEDYLFCVDESALTEGRECIKCLGTEVADYDNTTSLPDCAEASTYDGYEKVCQSATYLEVWAEIWCKKSSDTDTGTDKPDTEVADTTSTDKPDTEVAGTKPKSESSDGCSITGVAAAPPAFRAFALIKLLLQL